MLLAAPGDGLDDEVLIDRLWFGAPPINAAFSLRNQVAQLRRMLGHDAIERSAGGYVLQSESLWIDLVEFERLVDQGRMAEAFSLIRGPAFHEVRGESWAVVPVNDVEERIALAADRWGALRCLHPTEADVAWLRKQVDEEPHREARWEHLVTALVALGLRTEALRATNAARRALAEVGLTVGPTLRTAERGALTEQTADTGAAEFLRSTDDDRTALVTRPNDAPGVVSVSARDGRSTTDPVLAELTAAALAAGEHVVYVSAALSVDFASALVRGLADVVDRPVDDPWISALEQPGSSPVSMASIGDPAVAAAGLRRSMMRLASEAAATVPLWIIVNDAEHLRPEHRSLVDVLGSCPGVTVVLSYGSPTDVTEVPVERDRRSPGEVFLDSASRLLAVGGPEHAVPLAADHLDRYGLRAREPGELPAVILAASVLLTDPEHTPAAVAALDLAAQRAAAVDDPVLMADALLARGPVDAAGGGSTSIAERAAALADRVPAGDVARRVQLLTWAAHHRLIAGQLSDARALVDRAAPIALDADLPTFQSLVLGLRLQLELSATGSPAGAAAALERLRSWAALTHCVTADAAAGLLGVAVRMGDSTLDEAATTGDGVRELLAVLPRSDLRWIPAAIRAAAHLAEFGADEQAEALVSSAERLGTSLGVRGAAGVAHLQHLVLAHQGGRLPAMVPLLEALASSNRGGQLPLAAFGLALAQLGEDAEAGAVAERLAAEGLTLHATWPVVAMLAGELSWRVGHEPLSDAVWHILAGWSGWGLNVAGTVYLGAADTTLGLAASAGSRHELAATLLASGAAIDRAKGATWWAGHAEWLLSRLDPGTGRPHP